MDNSTIGWADSSTNSNSADVPAIKVNDPDEIGMLSVYLEVPAHNRRRRSYQVSISSEAPAEIVEPLFPDVKIPEALDVDEFLSPRLFTELLILTEADTGRVTWKETARWVRFEEDVEEGGERWSKPRISILQSHSFLQMRSTILKSHIIFDVDKGSLAEIINTVLTDEKVKLTLPPATLSKIMNTVLMKPIHLYEINKGKENGKNSSKWPFTKKNTENGISNKSVDVNIENGYKGNTQFLKKIPDGAEAAVVMVGEVKYLDSTWSALIRLKNTVSLGSLTEVAVPAKFIFILLGPLGEIGSYYEIGRSIATLLSDEVFREVAYLGSTREHLLAGMDEFLDASFLLPPGEWDPTIRLDPPESAPTKEMRKKKDASEIDEEEEERKQREMSGLVRTGRLFGGLINDIKRKAPWYLSDFKDGISLQSVATFFFLYFACLTPIVTFGGLLGEATNNNIAVMESLVAGCICGVVYGMFSGQPLTILGSTGPVLVFESIMYDVCERLDWNYLSFRLWIGLWAAVILIILVSLDASAFVCYITRFTEENFATLIALIFIYKAIEKVLKIRTKYPMETDRLGMEDYNLPLDNHSSFEENFTYQGCQFNNGTLVGDDCKTYYPDVYLMSIILFVGTFFISITLKNFKTASFFPTKVRAFISDFSVIIAIVVMSLMDMQYGIHTPKLHVPQEFKPTSASRGWIISPFDRNPWWSAIVAVAPAILACILLFMDQQITAVIINRKEHKLKKGCGYHLDLFVLSILIGVCSVMGLPWFVAATVLSINHVSSLHLESECAAPGEQPQFLGVRENRVTHILIFLCIGLSVFITPILQLIPMPVLFGVFMYMGISALNGIQLFERILILFMPLKYQPDHVYLRKVRLQRVHLYTFIQIVCLAVLWIIKSFKETSILFPVMLVIMIIVRKLIEYVFTQRELKVLDDALPEFKRKEKIEDEIEDVAEEDKMQSFPNRDRAMSIFVADGGVINIEDEYSTKQYVTGSERGSFPNSSTVSSRKSSVVSTRRGSVLEPIFAASHNYVQSNTTLRIPSNTDTFQVRKRGLSKDAINSEELDPLNK